MEEIKEINGTAYVLKLFPTTKGLQIIQRLQSGGFTDDVIADVVCNGCSIGSVKMDTKKFDNHFRGKYADLMELFAEILKFNNLVPDSEEDAEGNEQDSES